MLTRPGFPIRKSSDQCLFAGFPKLFAGYRVLLRLSMPRHPPCTLSSLTTFIDHRRRSSTMLSSRQKVLDDTRLTERPGLFPSAGAGIAVRFDPPKPAQAPTPADRIIEPRYSVVKEPPCAGLPAHAPLSARGRKTTWPVCGRPGRISSNSRSRPDRLPGPFPHEADEAVLTSSFFGSRRRKF